MIELDNGMILAIFLAIFFLNLCIETEWYKYFAPQKGFGEPIDKIICYIIFISLLLWGTYQMSQFIDAKFAMLISLIGYYSSLMLAKQIKKLK